MNINVDFNDEEMKIINHCANLKGLSVENFIKQTAIEQIKSELGIKESNN